MEVQPQKSSGDMYLDAARIIKEAAQNDLPVSVVSIDTANGGVKSLLHGEAHKLAFGFVIAINENKKLREAVLRCFIASGTIESLFENDPEDGIREFAEQVGGMINTDKD